ncbi:hypothetical protein PAXRUDRAFT_125695, partial [Paxillus rubicundulus Ve08.2h10]
LEAGQAHQCQEGEQRQLHQVAEKEHLTQEHREIECQECLEDMYQDHNPVSQEQHGEDEQRYQTEEQVQEERCVAQA